MKFIEDDFDLEEFQKSFADKNTVSSVPKNRLFNIAVMILLWLLAFFVAYPLYIGGQYIIDLFMR